jgi:predicted nucleic acid-binding protein
MGMSIFFDTNIFIYSVSHSTEDRAKKKRAEDLIAETDFALSLQVVQEFINTCLGKSRLGISRESMSETVGFLFSFPCALASEETVLAAIEIQHRFQIKYWDAAIIAAAQELGCRTVYSEDLNHGQIYNGVQVINPFLENHF